MMSRKGLRIGVVKYFGKKSVIVKINEWLFEAAENKHKKKEIVEAIQNEVFVTYNPEAKNKVVQLL